MIMINTIVSFLVPPKPPSPHPLPKIKKKRIATTATSSNIVQPFPRNSSSKGEGTHRCIANQRQGRHGSRLKWDRYDGTPKPLENPNCRGGCWFGFKSKAVKRNILVVLADPSLILLESKNRLKKKTYI